MRGPGGASLVGSIRREFWCGLRVKLPACLLTPGSQDLKLEEESHVEEIGGLKWVAFQVT